MTDKPSDRAIAQAFYAQYRESLRAGIKAHTGFWDGVFAKAKRIDAAVPEGAVALAEVVQREPYLDGSLNPMKELRWSLPNCEDDLPVGTKLYTAPPSLGGEDSQVVKWLRIFDTHGAASLTDGQLAALVTCSYLINDSISPRRCYKMTAAGNAAISASRGEGE